MKHHLRSKTQSRETNEHNVLELQSKSKQTSSLSVQKGRGYEHLHKSTSANCNEQVTVDVAEEHTHALHTSECKVDNVNTNSNSNSNKEIVQSNDANSYTSQPPITYEEIRQHPQLLTREQRAVRWGHLGARRLPSEIIYGVPTTYSSALCTLSRTSSFCASSHNLFVVEKLFDNEVTFNECDDVNINNNDDHDDNDDDDESNRDISSGIVEEQKNSETFIGSNLDHWDDNNSKSRTECGHKNKNVIVDLLNTSNNIDEGSTRNGNNDNDNMLSNTISTVNVVNINNTNNTNNNDNIHHWSSSNDNNDDSLAHGIEYKNTSILSKSNLRNNNLLNSNTTNEINNMYNKREMEERSDHYKVRECLSEPSFFAQSSSRLSSFNNNNSPNSMERVFAADHHLPCNKKLCDNELSMISTTQSTEIAEEFLQITSSHLYKVLPINVPKGIVSHCDYISSCKNDCRSSVNNISASDVSVNSEGSSNNNNDNNNCNYTKNSDSTCKIANLIKREEGALTKLPEKESQIKTAVTSTNIHDKMEKSYVYKRASNIDNEINNIPNSSNTSNKHNVDGLPELSITDTPLP